MARLHEWPVPWVACQALLGTKFTVMGPPCPLGYACLSQRPASRERQSPPGTDSQEDHSLNEKHMADQSIKWKVNLEKPRGQK
jgi:hypothetical protein